MWTSRRRQQSRGQLGGGILDVSAELAAVTAKDHNALALAAKERATAEKVDSPAPSTTSMTPCCSTQDRRCSEPPRLGRDCSKHTEPHPHCPQRRLHQPYPRWRKQFLITIGMFSLIAHVLQDLRAPGYPDWARMDCVVRSWIYGMLSNELVDTVMVPSATPCSVYLAIESQFLGYHETRALLLNARFRTFIQGDLSITDYCRCLKAMADALGDLIEHVTY